MKYNLPPEFKVLTAYNHPNIGYECVVIAETEDKVAFCEFEYENPIPTTISYEPRLQT